MRIQCTKNLQTYLKLDAKSLEVLPENYVAKYDEYGFHAHVKKINGRNVFIFMNNRTRYCLIFIGRFPRKHQEIIKNLGEAMFREMVTEGMERNEIKKYIDDMGELIFSNTSDRQLIGDISILGRGLECTDLEDWKKDEKFQLRISQWVNDSLMKLDKEYIVPRKELYKVISGLR